MDAPLNKKIERALKRKAARKKNDSNFLPVFSLHEQVLSLVKEANSKVPQKRHVTPRSALTVMNRSLADLSTLDDEARSFAVLKEVSRFLNVATKTFTASQTSNTDLLVAGHPLSALNASLSIEEALKKNAEWIAADPSIDESIRPLVASAHAAVPGSIEREHAFARLNANKTLLASYFKLDNLSPIIAAFNDGNSSAARRARVALQWRDRMGRWVEMGRGINFRFRLPDGSIQVGKGTYIGAGGDTRVENTSSGPSLISDSGLIEVSGVPGLAPGLYAINSDNAAVYQARIPGRAAPETPSFKDQFSKDIPSLADLTATRRKLPIGWKEQGAYYVSDDNYAVIPSLNGQPYSVLRLNENGYPTGDAVARVSNWAEVNAAIAKDEPAFDKEIARLESDKLPLGRIPGATAKDVINPQDLLKMQERRIQENKAFDEAQPTPEELGNNDLNGNPVPEGWVRDANNDRNYTREMPLRDGGTYPVIARLGGDGKYYAGHSGGWIPEPGTQGRGPERKFDTLDAVNKDGLPDFIDYLNKTFTKDNPIQFTPAAKETKNVKGFDVPKDSKLVAMEQNGDAVIVSMPDGRLVQYDTGGPEGLPFTEEQKKKFISDIKSDKTIWFDEEGKRNWKALLGDQATKNVNGFDVPKDSTLVAMEQNGDAIVVQMPNGDLVQYDTGGTEGLPLSKEQADKFISDIKSGESIWFDENGKKEWKALLQGDSSALDQTSATPSSSGLNDNQPFDMAVSQRFIDERFSKSGIDLVGTTREGRNSYMILSIPDNKLQDFKDNSGFDNFEDKENFAKLPDGTYKLYTDFSELNANLDSPINDSSAPTRSDNRTFDMSVAQRFIDERFSKSNIDLIGTTQEGYNSYMILSIPKDQLENFKDNSGFDGFEDKENFTQLPDGTYKLYTDFSELNANLDNPIGPDEPPTPPSGGTSPKTPSPNVPSAPELFNGFNVPDGAFKFNTVEYSPEGRVDEASRDFTDDPKKLATKFTPEELVQALSQALLGNSTDAALAEILSANVDDNNDMLDPADIQDNVDIPQVALGSPSGAGQLEFSAGAEYVLAEALFNAIWEAGLDPNRVVASIYDSVNGNNDNLNKLIEAQGGVPSAEEAQLVDDIMQEIRQLKDATKPGDSPVANQKQSPSPDPLPGSLIENIPIDFNNPDYYIPNPEAYIPSQPTVDENGYTDNPEILSADYEVADLMEQMLSGITDGSGAALLAFDNITVEVPIEAMRDALQYQDINTNQILLDLKKESNDMSDSSSSPALQAHSQMIADLIEQAGNTVDPETADKIRDAIDEKGLLDWSEADKPEIIDAIAEVAGPRILEPAPAPAPTPAAERRFPPTTGERQAIETPVSAPLDSPENVTPQFVYPGPRENGYTANNTILDSNSVAVGAGSRVQALSDGRTGTIIAVQNIDTKTGRNADYARIRFDDGTTAVRSARQIFGIDGGAPVQQQQAQGPGQLPPARRRAVPQDPTVRLNEPAALGTPVIAGNGDVPGVKLVDTPPDLVEFTNPNAKQSDYLAWGLRAPEVARAGRDRVTIASITDLITKADEAKKEYMDAPNAETRGEAKVKYENATKELERLVRDTFGVREGTTFGSSGYTIKEENASVNFGVYADSGDMYVGISFQILDSNGAEIGKGGRTLRRKKIQNPDGTITQSWYTTNDILRIEDKTKQQSGFAAAYNRYMENWYIANGFDKIKVHAYAAAGWDGGLVWALNGFNWEGPEQAARVPAILRKMANDPRTTEEEQQIIKKMQDTITKLNPDGNYTPETVPTPLEISQIGAYAESAKTASWAGKRTMLKLDWYGVKNLNPGAVEQRQALNYSQMRNARKRIENKTNQPNVSRELVLKVNSNEFADANPELAPYIDYIRDVLRSNRSLAVLSPGAKTALNRFVASQLLKGADRSVSIEDIIKLRTALDAEFKADNPLSTSNNFGVGDQLLGVTMDDVRRNNVPGFTTKVLGMYESGSNDTYMVTHNDSGQVFFVKKDSLATQYNINGAGAEVQADAMLRATGIAAGYETRVSNVDPEIIVMQRAGAGLPLLGDPMTASNALNRMSVTRADGTTIKVTADNFMDLIHTPEDAIRVMLVDLVISNMDRHNGNILFGVDGTDNTKIRILPIDHALSSFGPGTEETRRTVIEVFDDSRDNLYGMSMPVLTERLKQDELLALFRNEARIMMEGLTSAANLPTGKELDLIVSNFGSLDAYRKKIQERLDAILQPGGEGHQVFLNVLKPAYWAQR